MSTPEGRALIEKLPLEDLIGLMLIMAPKIGRVLDEVRKSLGVYVEKPKRGSDDQYTWYVQEFQGECGTSPLLSDTSAVLLNEGCP